MSKIAVYDLEGSIPTVLIKNDNQSILKNTVSNNVILTLDSHIAQSNIEEQIHLEIQINANEENETLDWLDKRKRLGDFGEGIALKYLNSLYKNVKSVANQVSRGFDIEVQDKTSILGFEVKTSEYKQGFFITYNELKKASELKDCYNIFLIQIEDDAKIVGYIINNPTSFFNIDLNKIMEPTANPHAYITPTSFYFKFKDGLFENLTPIELTKFK